MRAKTNAIQATELFVDPETKEAFLAEEKVDAHAQPLIGSDRHGCWWGTERAAWKLSDADTVVHLYGSLGPGMDWDGWFIATATEAQRYAETHGVKVTDYRTAMLDTYDAFLDNLA